MCVSSNRRGRDKFKFISGIHSLLLKVKTENLLDVLENGERISSRMDYTGRDESIYPELVKGQAPNKLFLNPREVAT